jgi:hypothetical protein
MNTNKMKIAAMLFGTLPRAGEGTRFYYDDMSKLDPEHKDMNQFFRILDRKGPLVATIPWSMSRTKGEARLLANIMVEALNEANEK